MRLLQVSGFFHAGRDVFRLLCLVVKPSHRGCLFYGDAVKEIKKSRSRPHKKRGNRIHPMREQSKQNCIFCKLAYKAVAQWVFNHRDVLKRSWAEAPSGQQHSSRAGSRGDMLDTDDNHMGYIHTVLPQVTAATVPWQTSVVYMLIQTDI